MNNFNNFTSQQKNPYLNSFNSQGITTPTNNIIWVQGIEGAKAWQLSPNSMAILLDSEIEGKMYIKVSDNIGMSSLRIFNYVEEIPANKNNVTVDTNLDLSQYVKKEELSTLIKDILNEQSISTTATTSAATNAATANAIQQPKIVTIKK